MNSELEALNTLIKTEADGLLYLNGLTQVLEKYGGVFISGSYFLDLMTWRDLDIYLANDKMNEETFFELGKEISLCIKPSKMNYRNEFIGQTEHLPKGYYWGCYATFNSNDWKIDVWAISSKKFEQKQQKIEELKSQINAVQRLAILKLKNSLFNHPLYRKKFFSVDIYNAVIEDNINSEENFKNWLEAKRGVSLN
ncbi:hypothetical protein [Paenibacillus sp. BC26]|uniref:hypothetical protein n=1 Tax=Paenibacillus sp. BC26 TaxID=1881032 RepID=UPI0008ED1C2E|nr:hypothetical protein [Paenibacillus sp. BC26]SFS76120.1 hypothetical protein SAMN05428962_2699 [Paenibacillus sp. BC26]